MTQASEELLRLAERCEQATGPDRERDAVIWLHLPAQEPHAWKHGGDKLAHAHQIKGCSFVPFYTASLDAAMTLVPEGCITTIGGGLNIGTAAIASEDGDVFGASKAATPALALCAAALRTLANKATPHG